MFDFVIDMDLYNNFNWIKGKSFALRQLCCLEIVHLFPMCSMFGFLESETTQSKGWKPKHLLCSRHLLDSPLSGRAPLDPQLLERAPCPFLSTLHLSPWGENEDEEKDKKEPSGEKEDEENEKKEPSGEKDDEEKEKKEKSGEKEDEEKEKEESSGEKKDEEKEKTESSGEKEDEEKDKDKS